MGWPPSSASRCGSRRWCLIRAIVVSAALPGAARGRRLRRDLAVVTAAASAFFSLIFLGGGAHGRPLRVGGRPLLAPTRRPHWSGRGPFSFDVTALTPLVRPLRRPVDPRRARGVRSTCGLRAPLASTSPLGAR